MPTENTEQPSNQPEGAKPEGTAVDWSKIDPTTIPFDVIKSTEAYQKQREEAINNRLKAKAVSAPESEQSLAEEKKPASDVDELRTLLQKQQEALNTLLRENKERETLDRAKLKLKEKGLDPSLANIVARFDGDQLDAVIETLEGSFSKVKPKSPVSGSVTGGNVDAHNNSTSIRERMLKRVTNQFAGDDPFDPNIHKSLGGAYDE